MTVLEFKYFELAIHISNIDILDLNQMNSRYRPLVIKFVFKRSA